MTEAPRKSTQPLLPLMKPKVTERYDIYPTYPLPAGAVEVGFAALAARLEQEKIVVLEGYGGVLWAEFRAGLDEALRALGCQAAWHFVEEAFRDEEVLEAMLEPFLGGDDPLFGKRYPGTLRDFFDVRKLAALEPDPATSLNILYGSGAALAGWEGPLLYLDVPKNEIQFRSRADSIRPLGVSTPISPKAAYKRFYFVDWVVLNAQKKRLLPEIDMLVDAQRPEEPVFSTGNVVRQGLAAMSRSAFRVRPWFEPGAWGGQWLREKVPELEQNVPNYAWSFELIVPENGLLFEADGVLLELSFDFLMFHAAEAVLGEAAPRFGDDFPIRFDYLDTFSGGNLSVQCHPRPDYIREHFGEGFTQDETYYILDCDEDAEVYLGLADNIEPEGFRAALEHSAVSGEVLDIERYVHKERAHKHDLFLIPSGTIHCSGVNNLVLEISATPYIFTFKMYDWQRLDLDGKPRPLNLERAFANLNWERTASTVKTELIAQPQVLKAGKDWQILHLPTHPEHFYDVWRLEFSGSIALETEGRCHVLNLVEGSSVRLETENGFSQQFAFAETFVVPAAAEGYTLHNAGEGVAKVVLAFVKPGQGESQR